jgi:hypothetical protein
VRDENGRKTWIEVTKPDLDDPRRTELWLQRLPEGKPIRIGSSRAAYADRPDP